MKRPSDENGARAMTRACAVFLISTLLVAAAGCTAWRDIRDREVRNRYRSNVYPANPVSGLKTVGIVVLDASGRYPADTAELTSALHSQIQQVQGLEVAPDVAVLNAIRSKGLVLPRDGLKAADDLSLDGLFVAIVTDYDPYDEPVISLGLTLFSKATASLAPIDLDRIIQGGKQVPMPDTPEASPVIAVFAVYDASQNNVRRRLKWFAEGRGVAEAGFNWEYYYRTMPNYIGFVSYEIVWELFQKLQFAAAAAQGR
jgi:hypothetical protein